LNDIARQHGIYLCIPFDHKDISRINKALKYLECCIDDVKICMLRNRLKMNDSKTEMMIFASLDCAVFSAALRIARLTFKCCTSRCSTPGNKIIKVQHLKSRKISQNP